MSIIITAVVVNVRDKENALGEPYLSVRYRTRHGDAVAQSYYTKHWARIREAKLTGVPLCFEAEP